MSGDTGMGGRILRMASTCAPAPAIHVSPSTDISLREGVTWRERRPGTADATGGVPLLGIRGRVDSVERALQLQLAYHTTAARLVARTPPSQRLNLTDWAWRDTTGALCAFVSGIVTATREHDGRLGRLMLLSPFITPGPVDLGEVRVFDSHLWLRTDLADTSPMPRLRPADPALMWPHVDSPAGRVALGDLVTCAARLGAYVDRKGRKRLGVAEWKPFSRSLLYWSMDADGRYRMRAVPRHLVTDGLTVLDVDGDGVARWADPERLDGTLDGLGARWPFVADRMALLVRG